MRALYSRLAVGRGHWQRLIAGSTTGLRTTESRRIRMRRRLPSRAGRIDRLIVGDLEAMDLLALGLSEEQPSVDCLVFGDVLEHLVDPWTVLARLARLVRRRGPDTGLYPQRPALLGHRQPDAREVGLSRRRIARPHSSAILHALRHSRPFWQGWIANLRYSAALVAGH